MSGTEAAVTTEDQAAEGGLAEGATDTENGGKKETFTKDDVERIVTERLARDRAQKYADYDQLKEAAAELAKIRESEKTEIEKFQEQLAAEKSARESAQTELAAVKRTQYGMDKGLPRDLAELLTADGDEGLDAQIEKLLPHVAKAESKKPRSGSLRSGASDSGSSTADPKERAANAIRQLFDR